MIGWVGKRIVPTKTCAKNLIKFFHKSAQNTWLLFLRCLVVTEDLFENASGFALGDRNYWSPSFFEDFRAQGLQIIAPFRSARREKKPFPRRLTNLRRRIETVIGQLAERFSIKRVWARDEWHFCSRLLRKVLAHTIFVGLCQQQNCEPLQMDRLLSNWNLHTRLINQGSRLVLCYLNF